jgi:hypothetical protein
MAKDTPEYLSSKMDFMPNPIPMHCRVMYLICIQRAIHPKMNLAKKENKSVKAKKLL